ncbi:MAG: type III glutamate--ammonia ligase [Isosphaeraceae bacterium]
MPLSTEALLRDLPASFDADGIHYVLAQFVDVHGAAKVKLVPAKHLADVLTVGAGFAGGAVWGMGQGPHSHDMCARIDPASYTPLPYEPGVARFAADLHVDDLPHPYCPRVNLRRILDRAKSLGYVFNVGIEPEFFLVARRPDGSVESWDPHAIDDLSKPCYDFKAMSGALGFLRAMQDGLNALGWGAYQADHEDANAQFEVNFQYADALATADRITFFRMMAGQIAQRFGAIATFMAKPFARRTGSGAHMHYHLADAETGANRFEVDPASDPRGLGLSPLAYQFLGGIMEHARALAAVTSPTVNCYKRLQVGAALTGSRSGYTWVPAFVTYGDNNRTQMLRVCGPGHVEDRSVSSACNPYLAVAAYLAAGLDGIERNLDPGEPNLGGNMYQNHPEAMIARGVATLPQSLDEALDRFEADPIVRESLGPIADEFLSLKRAEWREYHAEVGAWEIRRYLTAL